MAHILFEKLSGAGNDFIVIDNRRGVMGAFAKKRAIELCDRKKGIGADGVLLLEASRTADYRMRILNPDGSEADMCGNGVRCLGAYAVSRRIADRVHTVETGAGLIGVSVRGAVVKARLTQPKEPRGPMMVRTDAKTEEVRSLNTGVPHAVVFEKDLDRCDVARRGKLLRYHKAFSPKGTNVNFVRRELTGIAVRTYERGVEAETLACGTGSTASALIASTIYGLRSPVRVRTTGGEKLKVYFKRTPEGFSDVYLEGPIRSIFQGSVNI